VHDDRSDCLCTRWWRDSDRIFGESAVSCHQDPERSYPHRYRCVSRAGFRLDHIRLSHHDCTLQELSFLVRTFFFVYLGLLLNFKTLSLRTGLIGFAIVILLLVSRWMAIQLLKGRIRFSSGETQTVMALLPRGLAAETEDLNASIAELRSTFENRLRTVPFPPSIFVLSASAELALTGEGPVFRLVYLADARMAEETRALLVRWLEHEMQLTPGSIQMTYVAAKSEFEINAGGKLGETGESRLREVHGLLDRYPQLQVQIDLPGKGRARTLAELQKSIDAPLALPKDSPRAVIRSSPEEKNRLTVTLHTLPPESPLQKRD
jgi:hypothetical protein